MICGNNILIKIGRISSPSLSSPFSIINQKKFSSTSLWSHLKQAPFDGNHETAAAFEADPSPLKVNLGRGVYKDDNGKSWVLPSVIAAKKKISEKETGHEYLPFNGLQQFTQSASTFAFGAGNPLLNDRVATVQTISGTGALRVAGEYLSRFLTKDHPKIMLLPDPSYVNHKAVFPNCGFEIQYYRYYHQATNKIDMQGMIEDLKKAPNGSVLLLHACAHNPTGIDPSPEQWQQISQVALERNLVVLFDSAYQGFASGDPDKDAAAFRSFANQGHQILLAQSFSKNFGLYGERVGALNVVTQNSTETKAVLSQLNQVIRPMYSNPPSYGARIVSTVFMDSNLRSQWNVDVKTMAQRIIKMRQELVKKLKELKSKRDWIHITNQIGMFAYSGLSKSEVERLRKLHVYLNYDGRMSMTGVNSGNVEYLANSIHQVTSTDK